MEPCTNTIAQVLGWVEAPNTTFDKGTHEYIIGDVLQTITLPNVAIYCEQ